MRGPKPGGVHRWRRLAPVRQPAQSPHRNAFSLLTCRPKNGRPPITPQAVRWLEENPLPCHQLVIERRRGIGVIPETADPGGMVRASKPNRKPAEGEAQRLGWGCVRQVGALIFRETPREFHRHRRVEIEGTQQRSLRRPSQFTGRGHPGGWSVRLEGIDQTRRISSKFRPGAGGIGDLQPQFLVRIDDEHRKQRSDC